MGAVNDRLEEIAQQMQEQSAKGAVPTPHEITPRELVRLYGYERRGASVNSRIRNDLEQVNLRVVPDFEFQYADSKILIELDQEADGSPSSGQPSDPTYRVGTLEAANNKSVSVKPDNALGEAATIMELHDFSQLPVMENERTVRGIVSWKLIGAHLSFGRECERVRDCMETAKELAIDAPLFDAIQVVAEHGYVLVRGTDKTITGIVTATDLSNQLMQLAGPFLFIGEIEGYLRQLIYKKFTIEQMRGETPSFDSGRTINGSADLTLGEYCRLLENEDNWELLNLTVHRRTFVKHLDSVRKIRNDVMHFEPDGLSEEDTKQLKDFARFLRKLIGPGAL